MAGATLLSLPAALEPGRSLSTVDALFMAASAVSITGLAVVDVGTTFTTFGELILLGLVQLGGIGTISAATLVALATGRRLGFTERLGVSQAVGGTAGDAPRLLRTVLAYSLGLELLGFLLLLVAWLPTEGWNAPYLALFHAVSAFNNAGFSLFPDSLVRYAGDPAINLIIGGLVVLGGLGFIVLLNVVQHRRDPRGHPITLSTRMVLAATVLLVAAGWIVFGLLEWNNPETLGRLEPWRRIVAALFMSVTPRSGGFNTIDYTEVAPATTFVTLLLMFVGAGPSSTGGGVKITTFFVLTVSALSFARRGGEPSVFGRRIELPVVLKALALAFLGAQIVGLGFTTLAITDPGVRPDRLVFEAVSAFATSGLSMNLTPELSPAGRLVVAALMYLGRVGVLTFALAMAERAGPARVRYPAEDVVIG